MTDKIRKQVPWKELFLLGDSELTMKLITSIVVNNGSTGTTRNRRGAKASE